MRKRENGNKQPSKSSLEPINLDIVLRPFCSETLLATINHWLDQLPSKRHISPDNVAPSQEQLNRPRRGYRSIREKTPEFYRVSTPPETFINTLPGSSRPPTKTLGTTEIASSHTSLCRRPEYMELHLKKNGIFLKPTSSFLPGRIEELWKSIRHSVLSEPKGEQIRRFSQTPDEIECISGAECKVRVFFTEYIFPHYFKLNARGFELLCFAENAVFAQDTIPNSGLPSAPRISTPKPDFAYGYSLNHPNLFSEPQDIVAGGIKPNRGIVNASQKLTFPFLVVEFKGWGTTSGADFISVNQCLGDSAACVKVINNLNESLREYTNIQPVNDAAFSIEINPTSAALYVTWSVKGSTYYMKRLKRFTLEVPDDYIGLWRCVDNILRWGQETRLHDIRRALDYVIEQDRKAASTAAKGRTPPYEESEDEASQAKESDESEKEDNEQESEEDKSNELDDEL